MPDSTASAPVFIGSTMSLPHSAASSVDERAEPVVVERAARERDAVELLARGGDEPRVAVPEVHRRVGGEAVEVAPALDVGHPGAIAGCHDDGQRMIVVGGVLVLEADGLARAVGRRGHRRSSRVQHLTPPPPSSSSDRSTPIGL